MRYFCQVCNICFFLSFLFPGKISKPAKKGFRNLYIDTSERHDNGSQPYKLPFWYNKVFIFRSPSIHAARFDKLKIATACGELAENTLTFIDLISKAVICIYIYIYISFIIYIFTYDNNKRIYYILVLLQIYYFEISDLNAFNAIRVCSYTV